MPNTLTSFDRRAYNLNKAKVREILPEHFYARYPNLITFLEKYYNFLVSDDTENFTALIDGLLEARNIEDTTLEQLDLIFYEIGQNIVSGSYFDYPRFAAKNMANFYRVKGSLFSAEGFFRAFFGIEAEVIYPKRFIIFVGESPIGAEDLYVIQDGALYQIYSILIRSELPRTAWESLYKIFVHPAGFYLGSETAVTSIAYLESFAVGFGNGVMPDVEEDTEAEILNVQSFFVNAGEFGVNIDADITELIQDVGDSAGGTWLRVGVDEYISKYSTVTGTQLEGMYNSTAEMIQVTSPTFDVDSDISTDLSNTLETFDAVYYPWFDSDGV